MRKQLRNIFFGFLGIFALMFLFRIGYGYLSYPPTQSFANDGFIGEVVEATRGLANIASEKFEYKKGKETNSQIVQVDQKYEKTATVTCKTDQFEEDEKELRASIDEEKAIIQFQQKSGNKGNRLIYMQIGVQPDRFDAFIQKLKTEQQVFSLNVTKKDKTNEYRELDSKIKTLQSTRSSLLELKTKGGKIEEYINLENRILEIDEQLQHLGVQMGSYDSVNEFCTVKLTLREGAKQNISFMHRVKVALEWTVEYYLMLMIALFFCIRSCLSGGPHS